MTRNDIIKELYELTMSLEKIEAQRLIIFTAIATSTPDNKDIKNLYRLTKDLEELSEKRESLLTKLANRNQSITEFMGLLASPETVTNGESAEESTPPVKSTVKTPRVKKTPAKKNIFNV